MSKTHITEGIFNAVKTLLKGGATHRECADYMHISSATVSIIRRSEDYTEYKNNCAAMFATLKKKEKEKESSQTNNEIKPQEVVKEVRQSVTIQATHYMEQELRKTNELLTQISAKLAFIVDELVK